MIKFSDTGAGPENQIYFVSLGLEYIRSVPGILKINKGAEDARG